MVDSDRAGARRGRPLILMTDVIGEAMSDIPTDDAPSAALTIPTDAIARPIVALELQTLQEIHQLIRAGSAMRITDAVTFDRGDGVNRRMRGYLRELERQRKKVKEPVMELGRAIDRVTKEAVGPLKEASDKLSHRLLTYQRAEEEKIRQAEEKRMAAEKAAQEAEAAAAREAVQGDADAAMQELEKAAQKREAAAAAVPERTVKSASVRATTRQVLVVDDLLHIPQQVTLPSGEAVQLWKLDEAAVRRALMKGAEVPGAHLEKVAGVASAPKA